MERTIAFRKPPNINVDQHVLSSTSKKFFLLNLMQVLIIGSIQLAMMFVGNYSAVDEGGMGPGRRVYMGLFAGAVFYSCFICLFAVKKENFLEIVAFVIQNHGYVAFSIVQVYHIYFKMYHGKPIKKNRKLNILSIINSCCLVVHNFIFLYLAFQLFKEYGWKTYKRVRFDAHLRGAYHMYELTICLMKMMILFVTMFCVCYNQTILRISSSSISFVMLIAVIPITIIFCVLAVVAIQRELKIFMTFFIFLLFVGQGILAYEIQSVYRKTCIGCQDFFQKSIDIPEEVVLHLIYLATVAFIFTLLLAVSSIKNVLNFKKGLRKHFSGQAENSTVLFLGLSRNLMNTFLLNPAFDKENLHDQNLSRDRLKNIRVQNNQSDKKDASIQNITIGSQNAFMIYNDDNKNNVQLNCFDDYLNNFQKSQKASKGMFDKLSIRREISAESFSHISCCCCLYMKKHKREKDFYSVSVYCDNKRFIDQTFSFKDSESSCSSKSSLFSSGKKVEDDGFVNSAFNLHDDTIIEENDEYCSSVSTDNDSIQNNSPIKDVSQLVDIHKQRTVPLSSSDLVSRVDNVTANRKVNYTMSLDNQNLINLCKETKQYKGSNSFEKKKLFICKSI